ncbi:MAG: hypothetical protein JXR46_01900 [Calditrichaceae bacterium]|nr:hypothetical protein [Calditrichaceae bacterium]
MIQKFLSLFILLLIVNLSTAADEWFRLYDEGVKAMESGDYRVAIEKFEAALAQKSTDSEKIRTYGMHFIEYFPNREIGIAHYHLGNNAEARRYLQRSMDQEYSSRASEYLSKTSSGVGPPIAMEPKKTKAQADMENPPAIVSAVPDIQPVAKPSQVKLVGERMSVAVLPFENKGASGDLGEIVLDKMITALFNEGRFKVIERSQLERVLAEQKLGASGLIDASTAAELGRGLGVDAIVLGSVAATASGSISLDSRAIDTETAMIIVAHDAYSAKSDQVSVKTTVEYLAKKFVSSLPLVQGGVIRVDGGTLMIDVGSHGGIKKGIKCTIYREGNEIKHPVTGEVLGVETTILGEVQVTDPFDKYSSARIIRVEPGQALMVGDKFLTK